MAFSSFLIFMSMYITNPGKLCIIMLWFVSAMGLPYTFNLLTINLYSGE